MFRAIETARGVKKSNCIGAALVENGDGTWTMKLSSTTLNLSQYGCREADGRNMRLACSKLEDGDYFTVSEKGSINRGQDRFDISHYE